MKTAEIRVGQLYAVRVSGEVVPVCVERIVNTSETVISRGYPYTRSSRKVTKFVTTNVRTGRTIVLKASRLREPLNDEQSQRILARYGRR